MLGWQRARLEDGSLKDSHPMQKAVQTCRGHRSADDSHSMVAHAVCESARRSSLTHHWRHKITRLRQRLERWQALVLQTQLGRTESETGFMLAVGPSIEYVAVLGARCLKLVLVQSSKAPIRA